MRRALALVASVAVVASVALVGAAAAQDSPDVGDAVVENESALPQNAQGETVVSGLDDPDLSLIGVEFVSQSGENVDGTVELRIRSDEDKRIQIVDAFGSGGESIAILRPESRSLSQGVNVVEIDVRTFQGTAIVNVLAGGDTAQIPVEAGSSMEIPETENRFVFASVFGGASVVALLLAWIQMMFAGKEKEREL